MSADPTTDLDALVARMRGITGKWERKGFRTTLVSAGDIVGVLDALDALRTRLAATITERLDAVTRAELAETACLSARAERDAAQARVRRAADMLAVIHRDGGHYLEAHGWDKACADAEARVWALVAGLQQRAREAHRRMDERDGPDVMQTQAFCVCGAATGGPSGTVLCDALAHALTADDAALVARERARDAVVEAARKVADWLNDIIREARVPRSCGACGTPDASCDMDCANAAYLSRDMGKLRAALDALAAPATEDRTNG